MLMGNQYSFTLRSAFKLLVAEIETSLVGQNMSEYHTVEY